MTAVPMLLVAALLRSLVPGHPFVAGSWAWPGVAPRGMGARQQTSLTRWASGNSVKVSEALGAMIADKVAAGDEVSLQVNIYTTLAAVEAGILAGSSGTVKALGGKTVALKFEAKTKQMSFHLIDEHGAKTPEVAPFRVAKSTNPGKLAGGIIQLVKDFGEATVTAVSVEPVHCAVKAMGIAQEYADEEYADESDSEDGENGKPLTLAFVPVFEDPEVRTHPADPHLKWPRIRFRVLAV